MAIAEKEISPIWGRSDLETRLPRPRMLKYADQSAQLRRALLTFFEDQICQWQPDAILVVERSGTAILRALKEMCGFEWPWSRVISSASLDEIPNERLRNRRVLVFDDMMKSGDHLLKVLSQIEKRCEAGALQCNIRTAVFAVHESPSDGRPTWNGRYLPDAAFYKDLAPGAYRRVGDRLVELLQRSGSLMLDTEHIEIRFRLQQGLAQLSEALRRRADVTVFQSLGHRTNLTVLYPEDEAHALQPDDFPEGTRFTGIVRKCRVVQRQGNEFAIIPICYPSVPADAIWAEQVRPSYMNGVDVERGLQTFYAVALAAALRVLEWAVRDLSVAGSDLGSLELPALDERSQNGNYTLDHLRVMHPRLDVPALSQEISAIATQALSEGVRLRRIKHQPRPANRYTDKELHFDAVRLLQLIRLVMDDRETEDGRRTVNLFPGEIFALGRRMGWQDPKISTLFDILIDEAYLVPRVDRVVRDNRENFMRTFEPVGELVSERVRRFTTQWGLPRGF
jgi:hypothetical protein